MLPTAELESLRTDPERTLPDECVISRTTATEGSHGRPGASGPTETTVACRISPRSGGEGIELDQVTARQLYNITMPAETDIGPNDQITSGSRTFQVVGGTGERSYEITRRVFAEERNEGL